MSRPILRFIILKSNSDCRFSQNWASIPKYRSSLSAVSAVMPRLPLTISLILFGGTARSRDNWFMLNVHEFHEIFSQDFTRRNRIKKMFAAHYCTSMIIDDLGVEGVAVMPFKAYSPLLVNADCILSFPVASESVKHVFWIPYQRIQAWGKPFRWRRMFRFDNRRPYKC